MTTKILPDLSKAISAPKDNPYNYVKLGKIHDELRLVIAMRAEKSLGLRHESSCREQVIFGCYLTFGCCGVRGEVPVEETR